MRIDLTKLLDGKESEIHAEYSYTPDEDGVLLPDEIHLSKPIEVKCRVTDNHGYMTLVASGVAEYETVCARCLAPVSASMAFSVQRLIETDTTARLQEDIEHDDDYEDSLIPLVNGGVDIDGDLTETFVLELPMYHLCSEDCPGLCSVCGKRLAEGDCGCGSKKEIDPRLAILQKLLEKPE